jgi:long-chain acyl-CoA synthetase
MTTDQNYSWRNSYDPGVDWAMDIPPRPVFDMLEDTAREFGGRPAFDFLGKKYTWSEIHDLSNRFAAGLQKMGVGKGVHVGLLLPNTPYTLIAYYGVLKAGGTVVNFNPLYAEAEIKHQIEDSHTDIMITVDLALTYGRMKSIEGQTRLKKIIYCSFPDILPFPQNILFPIFKRADHARVENAPNVTWFHDVIQNDGRYNAPVIDPENDIAVLQYTGGTTGVPKGTMLTHYNVYANAVQSFAWAPDVRRGEQKMLGVLPFFHVFAMTAVMNFGVLGAMEIIALPRFELNQTLKTIHKKKPHFFPAVPAIYNAIYHHPKVSKFNLRSIEFCVSGGAPLPVEVKKNFESITGCVVVEGYGLTESSPVVCVNPLKGENIAGSIGLPIPRTIVEIINADDKTTPMKTGERGELCIRGPQVMKGYFNKPNDTADVIKNGRLHTGDVAVMDARGYVYIVDRIKDMIITNGYNVYPRNVEEAIYRHPDVEECIVAGLPDVARGEIVKAWIKLKPGRTMIDNDLRVFLGDKISKMEIPKIVEFRDNPLPRTMIGKLSRKDVVAQEKKK